MTRAVMQTDDRYGPWVAETYGEAGTTWTHEATGLRVEVHRAGGYHGALDPDVGRDEAYYTTVVRPPEQMGEAALYELTDWRAGRRSALKAAKQYMRAHQNGAPTTIDAISHIWEPGRWNVELEEVPYR